MKPHTPQPGSVIQFCVDGTYVYAIYTHDHPQYGQLLRVFDGRFSSPVENLESVTQRQVQFEAFYPLKLALKDGLFVVRDAAPIPDALRGFPIFRSGIVDPKTGKVTQWWLWDGEREWKAGEPLSSQHQCLPIRGTVNHTLMLDRIRRGWRSSDQV